MSNLDVAEMQVYYASKEIVKLPDSFNVLLDDPERLKCAIDEFQQAMKNLETRMGVLNHFLITQASATPVSVMEH